MSLRKEPCLRLDARALVVAVGFRWSARTPDGGGDRHQTREAD